MARPIIAVDIDDVLAAYAKGFVAFSNERWGTNLVFEDYNDDWADLWQVNHSVVSGRVAELIESDQIAALAPDTSAVEVLHYLKESYDLIIVTARQKLMKASTLKWIQRYYPDIFDEQHIHFAGMWDVLDETSRHKTKGQLVKDLGASYIIDDQLKHCLAAQQLGLKAILFGNYNWNQTEVVLPEGVTRVVNWAGIKDYFHGRTE